MIGREYHNYTFTVYKCPPVRDVSAPPPPCMEQESAPLRRNERSFLGHQLSSGLPMSSRGPVPAGRFQHIPSVSFERCWFARDLYHKQDKTKMQAKTQETLEARPPDATPKHVGTGVLQINLTPKSHLTRAQKYLASKSRLTRAQKCRILCGRGEPAAIFLVALAVGGLHMYTYPVSYTHLTLPTKA